MIEFDMIKHHLRACEGDMEKVMKKKNVEAGKRVKRAMKEISALTKVLNKQITAYTKK